MTAGLRPGAAEGKRPSIRDVVAAGPAPPSSGSAAELGKESDWVLASNAVGARVFKSLTPISADPAHVEGLVVWARRQGKKVTLFTGYYGSAGGGTFPEKRFALDDAKFFGNHLDAGQIKTLEKVVAEATNLDLRSAAAEARGALNLPAEQAKTLVVGQSKT